MFSTEVDDASVGVDEPTMLVGDVEAASGSVDVATTWAKTGLTKANPIANATMIALVPTNVMTFAVLLLYIILSITIKDLAN